METPKETIYRKVAVSERMPIEADYYITDRGDITFSKSLESFISSSGEKLTVEWWIEEIEETQTLHEKEVLIKAFSDVSKEFEGRDWIKDGRGSYDYNDEEYRKEVSYLFDAFEKIKSEVWANIKSKTFEYKNQIETPFLNQISQLQKEKEELIEMSEKCLDVFEVQDSEQDKLKNEALILIQKHKQ